MLSIHRVTQEKELIELQSSMTDKVARYEEREKISRDIHNSVGHTITAAIMAIDAAEAIRGVSAEKADSKVAAAGERMRESLQVIRDSVRLMDSQDDTSVSLRDLVKTLTICLRQFEMDANMRIQNNLGEIPTDILSMSINAEHARFLYGAAQECLTNSVKHGKASHVTLNITFGRDHVELVATDNGNGQPPYESGENKGFGLKKIDSYLKANGGYMTFQSGPGFSVTIWLPIEETELHERN
jgi:signal transduction histidine kinase